jgi:thiol-disulfide isomerase/thioredoxin
MKKLFFLSFLILSSCSNNSDFKLSASSDISDGEMVYLVQYKENIPVLKDSASVVKGNFTFSDSILVPEMHYIFFKNIKGNIPVILEPGNINITVYKDSLRSTKINGTKSNDDFKTYIDESSSLINELNNIQNEINYNIALNDSLLTDDLEKQFINMRKKLTDYEFDFMKNKNDSYISALILQRMVFERSIDYDKADSIMNTFDESLSLTSPFTAVEKIIENYKLSNTEAPIVGSYAPKFSGPGIDGEVISLDGIKSKYILIDFWASWCAPCRVENPGLAELLNVYSSDDFSILGVSLDMNLESWKKAIETDGIQSWVHISNLKYFNDPIAKLYDISKEGIPSSFLLNPERKIIARNIKGEDLEFVLNAELKANE